MERRLAAWGLQLADVRFVDLSHENENMGGISEVKLNALW
jgi:hypothetical protein